MANGIFGAMLDCSRNAVMKVEQVKFLIDCLAKMGYNALELYTEDTYEVEGEPYFGYLRGRYSGEEIKELDAYAKSKGIELIPCIQTLAHFTSFFKNDWTGEIHDLEDILLVGDERTYQFIDHLFASVSKNFSSRKMNIGMDEAHMVGLGRYLKINGYRNRFDILTEHLNRVVEIAKKYGFETHMWSDMFFRLVNNGAYCSDKPILVPESVKAAVPDGVDLVYWDYYPTDKNAYDVMFTSHEGFKGKTWFAGGAWCQYGFAPFHTNSLKTMRPALQSAKEHGVENILITLWGDNGRDCSPFAVLPALYTLKAYHDGVFDEEIIKQGFYKLFGVAYDDFVALEYPNMFAPDCFDEEKKFWNPCKALLYADPFMGLLDKEVENNPLIPYARYAKILQKAKARTGRFAYLFDSMQKLCEVLHIKADLGVRTRKAYKTNDRKQLKVLVKDYKSLEKKLDDFYSAFFTLWHTDNKPQGFEVQDVRLGGLIRRVKSCRLRLHAYLKGDLEKIDELEEEILPYSCGLANHNYQLTVTRSSL